MTRTNFQTQIIILEHAPESTWKGYLNIKLVGEWRGDDIDDPKFDALIRKDWFVND